MDRWSGPCIYCRQTRRAEGLEHVYPEALGQHPWTLPRGAVCDHCNSGTLAKLDAAVAAHPHISALLFLCRVPGKSGRHRERHGIFRWNGDDAVLDIPSGWVEDEAVDHDEKRVMQLIALPSEFRPDLFRRGLFKIALNVVTALDGPEAVLRPAYDEARRYVVSPKSRHELLPYVQRTPVLKIEGATTVRATSFSRYRTAAHDSIAMWLLAGEFFVDLLAPAAVEAHVRNMKDPGHGRILFHGEDGLPRAWDGAIVPARDFKEPVPG